MYYLTYTRRQRIIWGAGKSIEESKNDAIKNIKDYFVVCPEKCIDFGGFNSRSFFWNSDSFSEDSKRQIEEIVYSQFIKFYGLRTIKCSKKLYEFVIANGAEDFDDWKIIRGVGELLKRT